MFTTNSIDKSRFIQSPLSTQTAILKELDPIADFEVGEIMLTEILRKYDIPQMQHQIIYPGFQPINAWPDLKGNIALLLGHR